MIPKPHSSSAETSEAVGVAQLEVTSVAAADSALWRMRVGDRSAAMAAAQTLLHSSRLGGYGAAIGLFHRAWCHLNLLDEAACDRDLVAATEIFERLADSARLADCLDLRAQRIWIDGDAAGAIALIDEAQALAGVDRGTLSSYLALNLRGLCEWDCGDWDAALRSLTRSILLAEQTQSSECLSNALANCAGFHCDMFNFEEAKRLANRAREVALAHVGTTVWWTAGINAMLAHDGLGEAELAWQVANELVMHADRMPARKRVSYYSKFGFVALHAGQRQAAERFVKAAQDASGEEPPTTDLAWAQVQLHLDSGEHALGRRLAQAWLDSTEQTKWADTPLDVWRMLRALVDACKGMQDYKAALEFEQQASQRYAELVGRSARANRAVIEVELQTQRTLWQRDQALRLHREAQFEKQQLAALNAALTEANRAKERLLAIASHDLRQPLHALAMYLASLHADLSSLGGMKDQLELVKSSEETVDALVTMFGTLLDLSRLDSGLMQPKMSAVDVASLCRRLVREASARSSARMSFVQVCPGVEKFGMTDLGLLERCLRNVIENALRHAAGTPLCVALRRSATHWRIEVRDGGLGIAAGHLDAVFDEFYRVTPHGVATPGLGLGLAIVKRLCDLMQHPLSLRSAEGKGTVVCVRVPQCEPPDNLAAAVSTTRSKRGLRQGGLREKALRVVVIDDDASVRESNESLLARWGYVVDSAASGAGWTEFSEALRVDAFILDYRLGEHVDGVALAQQLRKVWGDKIPVLIVTAETSAAAVTRIRASGISYLHKPIQPARLRAWLARSASQQGL